MAFAIDTHSNGANLQLDLSAKIYGLMQRFANYAAYRRTVNELNLLTSRELADLGLNRSTVRSAAIEAVYGTQA